MAVVRYRTPLETQLTLDLRRAPARPRPAAGLPAWLVRATQVGLDEARRGPRQPLLPL